MAQSAITAAGSKQRTLGTTGRRGDGERRRRGEKRPEVRRQKIKIHLWERLSSRDLAILTASTA